VVIAAAKGVTERLVRGRSLPGKPLASTVRRIDAMWRVLGCSGDG